MRSFLQFCFFLLLSLSASALEDGHAKYVGGTVPGVTAGAVGRLDTTAATSLTFERAGNKLEIPYASVESYKYSKEVTSASGRAARDCGWTLQEAAASAFLPLLLSRFQQCGAGGYVRSAQADAPNFAGGTADAGSTLRQTVLAMRQEQMSTGVGASPASCDTSETDLRAPPSSRHPSYDATMKDSRFRFLSSSFIAGNCDCGPGPAGVHALVETARTATIPRAANATFQFDRWAAARRAK